MKSVNTDVKRKRKISRERDRYGFGRNGEGTVGGVRGRRGFALLKF